MNTTIELFPFAKKTKESIEQQNKFLRKVSLTGKINALDFSANLFEYTDVTIKKFEALKDELIAALVDESIARVQNELQLKAQLSIDVLKRNLFERTADIDFLASDLEIHNFLQDQEYKKEKLKNRLIEYINKYSVYDDVLIFDNNCNFKININPNNTIKKINDPLIKQALESDSYIEEYRYSDIFASKERSLLYAQKIVSDGSTIGVLCLSFKFDNELQTIYKALSSENDILLLQDEMGVIASSQPSYFPVGKKLSLSKHQDLLLHNKNKIAVQAKTKGYQGYFGLDWTATAISVKNEDTQIKQLKKQILSPKLKSIIDKAHITVEDLGDVIINGELIASKFRQYTLSPILDNLRDISNSLLKDIDSSAENLANTSTLGLFVNTKLITSFSIDLMDRNLYERANDCRWWALTPQFSQELISKNPNYDILHKILKNINDAYTVYTNLFIYDREGKIVATSQDNSILGEKLSTTTVTQTLQNRDSQKYFVSDFLPTKLYDDKPTYIYHASISEGKSCVGGIGIVFDADVEFKAILEDSTLEEKEGFSLFCNKEGKIIASTNPLLKPLDTIELPPHYFMTKGEVIQEFITYEGTDYLLSIAPSHGYREYKTEDNYRNDLYALSFVEI